MNPLAKTILGCFAVSWLWTTSSDAKAQETSLYSRSHIITLYGEYSNTSSHIIEGVSRRRRFVQAGLTYDFGRFSKYGASLYYEVGASPLTFIRDPVTTSALNLSGLPSTQYSNEQSQLCVPGSLSLPGGGTVTTTCQTRWTYAGSLSPAGFRLSLRNGHRIQPVISGGGSLVLSVNQTPVTDSARFNYMGDLGFGLEIFTKARQSWFLQYRIYHLSNGYTAAQNPGIDGQVLRVGYSFGR